MYAIVLIIGTVFGIAVGAICRGYLDRRANGAAGDLYEGTWSVDAGAADRTKRLEDTITRAESANAEAIKTIKGLQDLLDTVRRSSSNTADTEASR